MKVVSYTKTGSKQPAEVALPTAVFGVAPNPQIIGLAYQAYLAAGRSSHASTLTRGLVRGGGKKPWRQKGTGRARAGSSRLPHWRHGGVAFGPTGEENHELRMPVKTKRAAIRQALSLQAKDGHVSLIEAFTAADGKTKAAVGLLAKLKLTGHVVLVLDQHDDQTMRATANVAGLDVVLAHYLNVFTIMNADHLLITKPALAVIEQWLGEKPAKPAAKTEAKT